MAYGASRPSLDVAARIALASIDSLPDLFGSTATPHTATSVDGCLGQVVSIGVAAGSEVQQTLRWPLLRIDDRLQLAVMDSCS